MTTTSPVRQNGLTNTIQHGNCIETMRHIPTNSVDFILTDPLIVLAGAVLLDALRDLRFRKWTYAAGIVLFGLHIAVGQAEPVKYAFMRRGPESVCEWNWHYMPLLPLPWCSVPPLRP